MQSRTLAVINAQGRAVAQVGCPLSDADASRLAVVLDSFGHLLAAYRLPRVLVAGVVKGYSLATFAGAVRTFRPGICADFAEDCARFLLRIDAQAMHETAKV